MSKIYPRRRFLQTAAAGGLLAASVNRLKGDVPTDQAPSPPSCRMRFGIVGVGMQGSDLLRSALSLPGVDCVAAARPLRRPAHPRQGDLEQPQPAYNQALPGTSRPERYRLHHRRRARLLA